MRNGQQGHALPEPFIDHHARRIPDPCLFDCFLRCNDPYDCHYKKKERKKFELGFGDHIPENHAHHAGICPGSSRYKSDPSDRIDPFPRKRLFTQWASYPHRKPHRANMTIEFPIKILSEKEADCIGHRFVEQGSQTTFVTWKMGEKWGHLDPQNRFPPLCKWQGGTGRSRQA